MSSVVAPPAISPIAGSRLPLVAAVVAITVLLAAGGLLLALALLAHW
jgi:hypothetical protein